MDPVQWLIDFLRGVQAWGTVEQLGLVAAVLASMLLIIAWLKRGFRRGYHDIEEQNEKLRFHFESLKATLTAARRKNADLRKECESAQGRLPEAALALAEQEIEHDNYGVAIGKLRGMFEDLSAPLAECLSRLTAHTGDQTADGNATLAAKDAERYRQAAALLRATRGKAAAS